MTPNEIKRILFEHEAWLNGSGVRANLCDADLRNANLCNANLCAPGIHFFMTRGEAVNYD